MSHARVHTTKILTKSDDYTLLTKGDAETDSSDVEKIKNRSKQNFENEANTDMPRGGF